MDDKTFILINIGLAAICLAAIGVACIYLPAKNPGVIIYAFDQNPAGSDDGNEWITLHNPSNETIDIGNWTLETAEGKTETISEGVVLNPGAYRISSPFDQWLANSDESIILRDSNGVVVDKTPVVSDTENDNRYWLQKRFRVDFWGSRIRERGNTECRAKCIISSW
jgi:hypothetical protein